MSITVTVGDLSGSLGQLDENAITNQVNKRRATGTAVCVLVRVSEPGAGVDMVLSSPGCGGGGGGRAPNAKEAALFALWAKHHLDTNMFSGGDVIAFLKQLQRAL